VRDLPDFQFATEELHIYEILMFKLCAYVVSGLIVIGFILGQHTSASPANKKGYESYKYEKLSEELKKRAQDGDEFAQYNLGQIYEKGDGVKQNYAEAVKWFRKSAEQGNAWSQSELGVCYYQGKCVAVDHKKAFDLYMKSAEQDYMVGQVNLAGCYLFGHGTEKNEKEALKWYKKAFDNGATFVGVAIKEIEERLKKQSSTNPQQNP